MEHNNSTWQTLLEKWNSGNFTRADEQALQRLLAESDPFAREAMEGFLSNPKIDHHKHLESVRAKLAAQQPQRRAPLFQWATAAAAVLLLLTATWWLLPNQPRDIVAHTPHTAPTTADNNPTVTENKPQPSIAPTGKNKALLPIQQRDTLGSTTDIASNDNKDSEAPAAFSAPPQELVIEAPVAYTETESVKSESADEQKIQAQPQTSKPVAVQASPGAPPVAPAKKRSAAVRALPTPSVGWEKFNSDMETQVSLTPAAKENGVQSGVVTMIIDINPSDGKIRSVLFINRLGYGCDEIAARFVEQYTWQIVAGGATKMEVEVEFR